MPYSTLMLILLMILTAGVEPSYKATQEGEWHSLFNGKNLDGWVTYVAVPGKNVDVPNWPKNADGSYTKPLGVNNDPQHVFSVVTIGGIHAIRVSGKIHGAITTKGIYKNFHVQLRFKWGKNIWPGNPGQKRDSGLLYYAFGKHGGADNSWMKSHEFQIEEGDLGDYWAVGGTAMDIYAQKRDSADYIYDPTAPSIEFSQGLPQGRHCIKSANYEKPYGDWNTLDLYCYEGTAVHVVNGHVVMVLHNSRYINNGESTPLTKGRIQLQSEGAEIYYTDVKIQSIDRIPSKLLQ